MSPRPASPRGRPQAASRQDVARLAGVAPTTVSLVLNRNPGTRIPEATRQRVEEAARTLGYQSSALARALVTGRTGTVGAVIHFAERPFQDYVAGVLDGFWAELQRSSYRLLLGSGSLDACVAGMFRERSVDGILVVASPTGADDPELRDLVASGFPAVFVGSRPAAPGGDYVDIDNVAAARQATALLLAAGHRDILHLAGPLAVNSSAVDRRTGYLAALREAGVPVREELVIDCSYNHLFAEERLGAALDRGLRCTAIFAANHSMAQGAVRALAARRLRVPADVSVTAIDSQRPDQPLGCTITCLEQPLVELGAAAGRLLIERMGGAAPPPRQELLPGRLVPGDSIAPPPR